MPKKNKKSKRVVKKLPANLKPAVLAELPVVAVHPEAKVAVIVAPIEKLKHPESKRWFDWLWK